MRDNLNLNFTIKMIRRYIFVEVMILFLFSHVVWNGPSITLLSCSYEDSQVVQFLIQNKLLPILSRYRASLPLDCPFHSMRDVYGWGRLDQSLSEYKQDENKNTWFCPMCGKKFFCQNGWQLDSKEYYILSNGAEDAVCLASYCDIMRCEVIGKRLNMESIKKSNKYGGITAFSSPLKFDNIKKESLNIYEQYKNSEDNLKKMPCDANKMIALMDRCRAVIRQCTVGLLRNLSVKDFEDIEDEMNKAICSYLTCERFWDDNLTEVRHAALFLCIFLGLIIIGGFCFCYYIVWILFGSPKEDQTTGLLDMTDVWCNDINANNNFPVNEPLIYPSWAPQRSNCTNSSQLTPRR